MEKAEHFFTLPSGYTSIGLNLQIAFEKETLHELRFKAGDSKISETEVKTELSISPFANAVFLELAEYFMGKRTQFTIPIHAKGTDFQRSVWDELLLIPYGSTCSYKDIAMGIGNPRACRAVGLANNRNPLSILIPCHRVIGADGSLMGYAGQVPVKAALLALEKHVITHN